MQRLGDYIKEYSARNKLDEEIPVYSVTNSNGFCRDYFGKEVASNNKRTYKIVPRNAFAYNPSRINVGSVDYQHYEDRVIVSPLYNVFTVDEKILPQYLYFYLKSPNTIKRIRTVASGSVRDNLKLSMLCEFPIQVPSINRQQNIIELLEKTQRIIDEKNDELEKLDNLIKARFVEMFNCDKSNIKKLSELTETITKGTTPTTAGFSFEDDGINFFKIESITDDHRINLQKVAHVNEECHSTFKRSQLKEGDVLFSIAGAIGRTAIIHDKDLPGNTNQALAIIRLKANSNVSRKYLISALESLEVVEQYRKKKRGVAQMNLSLQDIGNISIPVPNSTKQSEFEKFAQQVDKSKFAVQKSLEKTQLLFDSLMQEYFG